MANSIKYSTTGDTLSLKKGNIYFGVGDVGKGPSSATTYYNGVTPSAGGYTIYSYNASQTSKLSFHSAANDTALREYTNNISGQSFASAAQCLNWYATQTNYVCVNRDYEGVVTSGLTFIVDAGFTPSYTTSGTTWYDLGYNGNNGTLTNGPTFNSSNGGSIVFDGVDDYIPVSDIPFRFTNTFTLDAWVYFNGSDINGTIIGKRNGSPYNQYSISIYSGNPYLGGVGKVATFFGREDIGGGASDIILNYTLPSAGFYNIVSSINTTTQTLYINGVARSTTSVNISSNTYNITGRNLLIGATNNDTGTGIIGPFAGNIYNTKIYNRALSATEVLQNFNAQKSRFGL